MKEKKKDILKTLLSSKEDTESEKKESTTSEVKDLANKLVQNEIALKAMTGSIESEPKKDKSTKSMVKKLTKKLVKKEMGKSNELNEERMSDEESRGPRRSRRSRRGSPGGDDMRYVDMKLPPISPGLHPDLLVPPSGDANDPYGYNARSRFNPQYYRRTQLPGPYASAAHSDLGMRRLLSHLQRDDTVVRVQKCAFGNGFEFCAESGNGNDINVEVNWSKMVDRALLSGPLNQKHVVFRQIELLFHFGFSEEPILCHEVKHEDIELFRLCVKKDELAIWPWITIEDMRNEQNGEIVNLGQADEWNETYSNINRKCTVGMDTKICMTSDGEDVFRVDIHIPLIGA